MTSDYSAKITEIEGKILDIENKIPDVSGLATKTPLMQLKIKFLI